MRPRSLKRQRLMSVYVPRARAFVQENPVCQFPLGCDRPSAVVHHTRGKRGLRLLDEAWWKASCHEHNMLAEDDTGAALDCGWLIPVESIAAYAETLRDKGRAS